MRLIAISVGLTLAAFAQWPEVRLHPVASGFRNPTAIVAPPDGSGRLFVLEQPGRVRVIRGGVVDPEPVLTLSRLSCCGERGLLGIAFPPGFASKRYFYLSYTDPQGSSIVSRWRLTSDDRADPASEEVILTIRRTASNHNGGNIVFGPDGYLYVGTGDSGGGGDPQNAAQSGMELRGKMLRIDTESGGSLAPAGNPFVGRTGYLPEIWAVGLRNPWKYSFDRDTGDLWIADVGQNRAEEINFQPAASRGGENYGWRIAEGLACFNPSSGCNRDGLTLPILEYTRDLGVSVTGGFVYRGKRYPDLRGMYLYADFGSGRLWGARRSGSGWENRQLLATGHQVSTFGEDENGELYLADHSGGSIYLIAVGSPAVTSSSVVNAASFGSGIVPGSLATAFGTGLTSFSGIISATSFPLPTQMAGTQVTLNGIAAPITGIAYANGQEQINFQVPWELAGAQRATFVVLANGALSAPVEVPLTAAQPEIFAITRQGEFLIIWATGLGEVSTPVATGAASPSRVPSRLTGAIDVNVGGVPAEVVFAGLAPGFAGLYQINVASTASGDIVVRTGGATSRPLRTP